MDGLTGPWLAARLGVDPLRIELLRRSGELVAVRREGADDWIYPSWQFDEEMQVRPEVREVLAAAGAAGIRGERLAQVFERRVGLAGGKTVRDAVLAGDTRAALSALRG